MNTVKYLVYADQGPDSLGRRSFTLFWLSDGGVFRPEPHPFDGEQVGFRRAQCFKTQPRRFIEDGAEIVPSCKIADQRIAKLHEGMTRRNREARMTPVGFYGKCWDILVAEAEADPKPDAKRDFVLTMVEDTHCDEYRFGGTLGFGGKFYRDSPCQCCIRCYSEDLTPEIQAVIDKVNGQLQEQIDAIATPVVLEESL